MNIGDLVMTPKGVARITTPSAYECDTTRGGYDPRDIHLLTDAEAFEIAEHPVPEGARIHNAYGMWLTVVQSATNVYDELLFSPSVGWMPLKTYEREPWSLSIDLRRTPASDTWDALPQIVREKVEEALKV